MKAQYKRKLIDSVDNAIGDIIEEISDKYYSDAVTSNFEYEKILYSIAHQIRKEVFNNNATIDDVINYLNNLRTKKSIARLVLSYMIARAREEYY